MTLEYVDCIQSLMYCFVISNLYYFVFVSGLLMVFLFIIRFRMILNERECTEQDCHVYLKIMFAKMPNQFIQIVKKVIFVLLMIIILTYCIHPGRFAHSYAFIKEDDMIHELEVSPLAWKLFKTGSLPLCPWLTFNESNYSLLYPKKNISQCDLDELSLKLDIKSGGTWKPPHCIPRFDVAIIVPYRNRQTQLEIFLSYMHSFLQKQMLNYRILVIEQGAKKDFNRAKLLNIGYTEALKLFPYHCFIFHDVDLIPQTQNNIYACTHQPRHMSSSLNTFRYNLPYPGLFGGAVAILKRQFELVNGFSNMFFGWGGEDDDFKSRINNKGLSICRFSPRISRYVMLSHSKELPSETRFSNLLAGKNRYDIDGINTLIYTVRNITFKPLYTWISVDI